MAEIHPDQRRLLETLPTDPNQAVPPLETLPTDPNQASPWETLYRALNPSPVEAEQVADPRRERLYSELIDLISQDSPQPEPITKSQSITGGIGNMISAYASGRYGGPRRDFIAERRQRNTQDAAVAGGRRQQSIENRLKAIEASRFLPMPGMNVGTRGRGGGGVAGSPLPQAQNAAVIEIFQEAFKEGGEFESGYKGLADSPSNPFLWLVPGAAGLGGPKARDVDPENKAKYVEEQWAVIGPELQKLGVDPSAVRDAFIQMARQATDRVEEELRGRDAGEGRGLVESVGRIPIWKRGGGGALNPEAGGSKPRVPAVEFGPLSNTPPVGSGNDMVARSLQGQGFPGASDVQDSSVAPEQTLMELITGKPSPSGPGAFRQPGEITGLESIVDLINGIKTEREMETPQEGLDYSRGAGRMLTEGFPIESIRETGRSVVRDRELDRQFGESTPVSDSRGVSTGKYAGFINAASQTHKVPVKIIETIIGIESSGDPNAVSPKGAGGLMQVMPATWAGMGYDEKDRFDPETNIEAGTRYLRQMYDKFGNWNDAVRAYNAGPGAVSSGKASGYRETRDYAKKFSERTGGAF